MDNSVTLPHVKESNIPPSEFIMSSGTLELMIHPLIDNLPMTRTHF
jgi:hypothetical protein